MEKENYHHGSLKEALIEEGLVLINNEGLESFSLRKVAARCGVSHAAPYKHFKNKEELLSAISDRVTQNFKDYLGQVAIEKPGSKCMIEMGKAYVSYMVKNSEYFKFMFFGELKLNIKLENDEFIYEEYSPFAAFYQAANITLSKVIQDQKQINMLILNMWSQVHGLSTLIVNNIIDYNEDVEELVEKMLTAFSVSLYAIKCPRHLEK